jgi:thiamine kinase-like enzyme
MILPDWAESRMEAHIAGLGLWPGKPALAPLPGGLCNRSWVVTSAGRRFVARVGFDSPVHGIRQGAVQASMMAAAALGVAPHVRHAEPNLTIADFIEGRALANADVHASWAAIVERVKALHACGAPVEGTLGTFSPFQAIRRYVALGRGRGTRLAGRLDDVERINRLLERAIRRFTPVFTHNDLVPQNMMKDGAGRVWLVDWDYGGFGHPMFDLAAIGANADGDEDFDRRVLAAYAGHDDESTWRDFLAFKLILSLREWMWGMAQELTSTLSAGAVAASMGALYPGREPGYEGYTNLNGERFERSWRLYGKLFEGAP